ncbi:hypothetical protein FPQ18DRAFT_301256 [Pyronema domesticum]|nr:hypothetical protein FPQ18DRAFT_301256 [Pyronema domesticum]
MLAQNQRRHIFIRLLEEDGPMKRMLKDPDIRRRLKYLIVDECHYMLSWGNSFRTDYANIGDIRAFLDNFENAPGDSKRIPIGLFTATATPEHLDATKKKMKSDLPWLIPKGTTDANIDRIPPAIIYYYEFSTTLKERKNMFMNDPEME